MNIRPVVYIPRFTSIGPRAFAAGWFVISIILCTSISMQGQVAQTGTVQGRVYNETTGSYLENARITVEGTNIETFTDSAGSYRLSDVPAGIATIKTFFTGVSGSAETVTVVGGQSVQLNITLSSVQKQNDPAARIVKLSKVTVSAPREMTGAAIAINQQRFAPNESKVASAEEFGTIADGNVVEFMKFLPGVTIVPDGADADGDSRGISIEGVPANNVPISSNGFSLASGTASTGRNIELDQTSLNALSRIEVSFSPTPESPGGALAGSINLVPQSAFERSKPLFTSSASVMISTNDQDPQWTLRKIPGPKPYPTRQYYPAFEFSYIRPVNERFGFTLSGITSTQYRTVEAALRTWRGTSTVTNGTTFPDTTADEPYLTSFAVQATGRLKKRASTGATVDYRLSQNDRVSLSFMYGFYAEEIKSRRLAFTVNRVGRGGFTPTSTRSDEGQSQIVASVNNRGLGGNTYAPTLIWRHDGSIWRSELGVAYSRAKIAYRDVSEGYFNGTTALRTGVTVLLHDIDSLQPRSITVTEGSTGLPVDPYDITSYVLTTATSSPTTTVDGQRNAYGSIRRDFDIRGLPLSIKAGFNVNKSSRDRDLRFAPPLNFIGKDGRGTTTPANPLGSDDGAAMVLDETYSKRNLGYDFGPAEFVSNYKLWELYNAHPEYFTPANLNTQYRNFALNTKLAEELISALYIRGDASFFAHRLKLVTGIRAEQTNVTAEGPLSDPTRNFQRDATGKVIVGSNGVPLPITTDPLEASMLTLAPRGLHVKKEYLRLFPSINASYSIRDNVIVRASYYTSIGRPDFNQYAGGITIPNTEILPSPTNQFVVSNAGIKAWSAKTGRIRLEYFFADVGQISVGAYRRDFTNFFGSTVAAATPQFLALYALDDPVYGEYDVATQHNLPDVVTMEGLQLDYKQALTFLPHWARGVQVFANATKLSASGTGADHLNGFAPHSGSWGISISRNNFIARVNWNYTGRLRFGPALSGRGIAADTYRWKAKRTLVDCDVSYRLPKHLTLFVGIRNLLDAPTDRQIANDSTPSHALLTTREQSGVLWTLGVKGSY